MGATAAHSQEILETGEGGEDVGEDVGEDDEEDVEDDVEDDVGEDVGEVGPRERRGGQNCFTGQRTHHSC